MERRADGTKMRDAGGVAAKVDKGRPQDRPVRTPSVPMSV